jgi:predicted NBD/HSP70 family sugar kinase
MTRVDRPTGVSRTATADQRTVRLHNLAAVAHLVRSGQARTRREIGELLGLNKVTVSSLVVDLIGRGLIQQTVPDDIRGVGRPSAVLGVDDVANTSIVVEILPAAVTVTTWSLSLVERTQRTIAIRPAEVGPDRTIARIATEVRRALSTARDHHERVVGVAVALPGVIESGEGRVRLSGPLGWSDVPLRERLVARIGADCPPIQIERSANMATVAEWRDIPGCSSLVYLDEGSAGLGIGLVVENRLLTGYRGRAGELLFPSRTDLARLFRLDDLGLEALLDTDSSQARPAGTRDAQPQLSAGTQAALERLAEAVAECLATLVALLDPELVVLGGHFTTLGQYLGPLLRHALDAKLARVWQSEIPVHFGVHGVRAARLGAATILADSAFAQLAPDSAVNGSDAPLSGFLRAGGQA